MKSTTCDVIIIGTGMSGMAAALFAARCGLDTALVGQTGELGFASGLLDLLGVHPVNGGAVVADPWQGIAALQRDAPQHPYARMRIADIREAFRLVLDFLKAGGYPYTAGPHSNQTVLTPVGTLKTTYAVPHTMAHGPAALANRTPCLLVDIDGLKGYSARQIAACLADRWPGLRPVRISFPEARGELFTEHMARALDAAPVRAKLVTAIQPHLGNAVTVGLPAVLGMYRTVAAMDDLQRGLGVPVFEIPTMLPAVGGLRLWELFALRLPELGIRSFFQQQAMSAHRMPDGCWRFVVAGSAGEHSITARCVVVCTGRFFGKGLHADRQGIRETLFGLPVVQPSHRAEWHHKDLLHPDGHPINRAGVAVDADFRPLDGQGHPVASNLFAAGTILAHQDWVRQKCGSGLAIATAYGAVRACAAAQ